MNAEAELQVDAILKAYAEKKAEADRLKGEVAALVQQIDALAGDPDKETGTIWLVGASLKAKITRRVNTGFTDKDKLAELIGSHKKELMPLFSIQFKEKAGALDKFLVAPPDDQKEIAAEVEAIFKKTPGAPSIEVVLK